MTGKNSNDQVGVIGGGLGGLAAACTLAARGYRVTLFERSSHLGGKAAVLNEQGFRFDMGPTILTLPSVLKRIFTEAGKSLEDYLTLLPLDPQWRCFFTDGNTLDLVADAAAMRRRIEQFSGNQRAGEGYERFMGVSSRLHEISDRFFFWKSVGSVGDTLDWKRTFDVGVLSDLFQLRFGRTVAGTVRRHVPDARVAQMMDHFTQYVGSAPDASPAVLCGIAHMQTDEGVWYPQGGTRAVPDALVKLGSELGVTFETGTAVEEILLDEQRVAGLRLADGRTLACGSIVSNCDSVLTMQRLVGGKAAERFNRRRNYEPACSGVVLYLGLDRRYSQLLHHNFIFSKDPAEEFEDIYRRGRPALDPTCYVCAPAGTEAGVAPDGGEALYILVHTPYLRDGHDWTAMLPRYREVILDKLHSTAGLPDLRDHIVLERSLTPDDIQRRYSVPRGAIYGLASHGRFLGAFKPANRSPDLPGLYLAGGAAHPGPGMPMVMMSGWIAADALDCDNATRPSQLAAAAPPVA